MGNMEALGSKPQVVPISTKQTKGIDVVGDKNVSIELTKNEVKREINNGDGNPPKKLPPNQIILETTVGKGNYFNGKLEELMLGENIKTPFEIRFADPSGKEITANVTKDDLKKAIQEFRMGSCKGSDTALINRLRTYSVEQNPNGYKTDGKGAAQEKIGAKVRIPFALSADGKLSIGGGGFEQNKSSDIVDSGGLGAKDMKPITLQGSNGVGNVSEKAHINFQERLSSQTSGLVVTRNVSGKLDFTQGTAASFYDALNGVGEHSNKKYPISWTQAPSGVRSFSSTSVDGPNFAYESAKEYVAENPTGKFTNDLKEMITAYEKSNGSKTGTKDV